MKNSVASPANLTGHGAPVVEDVLHCGKAEGYDARVDDTVENAVEFLSDCEEQEQHRETLERLLDQRSRNAHREQVRRRAATGRGRHDGREDAVELAGHERGSASTPHQGAGQDPRRLRVIAVQPQPDEQVGRRGRKGHADANERSAEAQLEDQHQRCEQAQTHAAASHGHDHQDAGKPMATLVAQGVVEALVGERAPRRDISDARRAGICRDAHAQPRAVRSQPDDVPGLKNSLLDALAVYPRAVRAVVGQDVAQRSARQ